jgi:dehydrogenase/reductase SDR family member 7B
MTASMKNRTVWITGASSGIGEALARECARQGASVVLSARRADLLEQVRLSCERPDDHMVLPLDITHEDTHSHAFEKILERFGSLDILINNGGIGQKSRVANTSLEVERRIMHVNYFGAVSLTKTVLKHFLERDSGRIVVISSVMGKLSIPYHATYAASKHALHGYFNGLRSELSSTGVSVTIICPGYIRTDISYHTLLADGSELNRMDPVHEKAMPAEVCARRIVRAVVRGKAEAYMGGIEIAAIYINQFFPRLFRFLMPRVLKS